MMQPMVYHAVTSAPEGADAAFVRGLLERDATMVPADLRDAAATQFTGMRDRMAGDGAYIFLAPARPQRSLVVWGKPTFAFDAAKMWSRHRAALRIKDLSGEFSQVGEYSQVGKLIRGWQDDELDDPSALPRRGREFEMVAAAGTQRDAARAWQCFLAVLHGQFDRALMPPRPSAAEVDALVDACARPKKRDEFRASVNAVLDRLQALWSRGPSGDSEVLVPDRVPLREAAAWSLDCEKWVAI